MTDSKEFDVIIVGGGTTGLVLANRLSEDSNLQVLIIEAGSNRSSDPKVTTPGFVFQMFKHPDYDYCYHTVPQSELNGREVDHPQGKLLGGSSAINALTTNYPSPNVFSFWSQLGNKGWDAQTMAPYYAKFETFNRPLSELAEQLLIDNIDYSLHGTNGPVQTSIPKFVPTVTKLWNQTFQNLGLKATGDPIAGKAVGSFVCANYIDPKTSTRCHAGVAYYDPVSSRPNLTLQLDTQVEKILFNKAKDGSVVATGVQTASGLFHSRKEVIVSAGAFNSPAILERSGIGSPDLLTSLGIDVQVANPNVGENLQDHVMSCIAVEVADANDSLDSLRDPQKLQETLGLYFEEKSGPLSSGFGAMGYLPVSRLFGSENDVDIKELISKHVDSTIDQLPIAQQMQTKFLKTILTDPNDSTGFIASAPAEVYPKELSLQGINTITIVNALNHPFSRGSSHIRSQRAADAPMIDPKYLSHPIDLEILARHVLFTGKLTSTEPLASMLKKGGKMNPPSLTSLEEAKDWIQKTAITIRHPSGTCAMMAKELGGVVDNRLCVHGTKNLRVVDASIFPMIPKGPLTSSVYALAERAADIFREDLATHA